METTMRRISFPEALATGVTRGVLCGFDEAGEPLVDFPANASPDPVAAISTVPLGEADKCREVILLFEDGDPGRPIIVGVRQSPMMQHTAQDAKVQQPLTIEAGGERLIYTAQKEIVLRCGKASIQLLNDGSIRIRGTNVLSRASATNRIRGGNIQIN
jgi:hypothetical protein